MFSTPDGATPIDDEEAAQLLPSHLNSKAELNAWEQSNIVSAVSWARRSRSLILTEAYIRELHKQMFNETWEWAGTYRTSNKNIGVDCSQIVSSVADLVKTVEYWISNETYSVDETAIRAHHRLVLIHPFPNGNGRHARLWSDIIAEKHNRPPFDWNNSKLNVDGDGRKKYIRALRRADNNNYEALLDLLLIDR